MVCLLSCRTRNDKSNKETERALIEVDGVKLKCVYWITQHKDGGKGKNRDTLKTIGKGHEASDAGSR